MFKRTRITLQIILTLISFFGFNEAVLAVRYRNTVYISNHDVRMVMGESSSEAASWLGYAGSGDTAALAGDPGNLKYNESPIKLLDYALRDLVKNSGNLGSDKSVDLVIGIAGYDFFSKKPAPSLNKLDEYRYMMYQSCQNQPDKKAFFTCMARAVFTANGFTVNRVELVGDHTLMAASAKSWLKGNGIQSRNFDLIQATTTAVPYKIRQGRIQDKSAKLPSTMSFQGGFWDIGLAAQEDWFSPIPYNRDSFVTFTSCNPVRSALAATDYAQQYGQQKGDEYALFKRWSRTGINSLGYQVSRLYADQNREDYLTGQKAVNLATYQEARKQSEILVNDVLQQMVSIINLKQQEYYLGEAQRNYPIVILGEFAADVLASQEARNHLLQSLSDNERDRVQIIPGDDFFQNLSGGGLRLLQRPH